MADRQRHTRAQMTAAKLQLPSPRFARQRHDIARKLADLDRLEQLATG
jgi:hypothetical protein